LGFAGHSLRGSPSHLDELGGDADGNLGGGFGVDLQTDGGKEPSKLPDSDR